MSEYIQNREHKQEILKGLITDLHKGRDIDEVRREFARLVEGVDATEIAAMEQRLINEGMNPEEIKKMCDVHAAVFKESLSRNERLELPAGHPLDTLKKENSEAKKVVSSIERYMDEVARGKDSSVLINDLREKTKYFYRNIDRHFSKKENIFFPYLERHQITGPPSVMWSVDDEIRDMLKGFLGMAERLGPEKVGEMLPEARESFKAVKDKLLEMFFKEEEILSPMMTNTFSDTEWAEIKEQSAHFGEIFSVRESGAFKAGDVRSAAAAGAPGVEGSLELDTGSLTPLQVNSILTNLPVDVTFVDKNDEVRYFSQGRERIFTRTKAIIGRKVQNCHPPESVHMVERIVNDFRTGRQSNARFWLELGGRFIHIEYTALRDAKGEYMGTMEVTQDITGLRALEGERRLLHYSD